MIIIIIIIVIIIMFIFNLFLHSFNQTGSSSKAVAADQERPTSSSGPCHKSAVYKTMCKVLKGSRKGAGKKETGPGSVDEKGGLLSSGE